MSNGNNITKEQAFEILLKQRPSNALESIKGTIAALGSEPAVAVGYRFDESEYFGTTLTVDVFTTHPITHQTNHIFYTYNAPTGERCLKKRATIKTFALTAAKKAKTKDVFRRVYDTIQAYRDFPHLLEKFRAQFCK